MAKTQHDLEIQIGAKDNASKVLKGLKQEQAGFGTAAKAAMGAAAVGVAAFGAAVVKSISTAASFQQQMAGVSAITGATGEKFDALTKLAKEMGSTTKFSATDAAEGIQFLGMAGFDTDEIMKALPETLSLAAAGNLELGAAADIASNVLSGMRLPVEDLSGVVDGLAVTAASSNTSVAQLGEGFKQVAPGAAAAGLSFTETSAALGALADNGIQAGAGGTALNAALRTILKPSDEAAKKMKELGLTFMDSSGKVRPMTEIIADLEKKNISATDALVMFGEEGGKAINALVGSGSKRLKELTGKIEDGEGAAKKMADTMSNTFEGAMTSLGSATEGLMITIGERFLPVLADLLNNYVTPAVRKFNEWMDAVGGLGGMFETALEFIRGFGASAWNILDAFFSDSTFRRKFLDGVGSMISAGVRLWTNYMINLGKVVTEGAKLLFEPIKFAFGLIWQPIKYAAIAGMNAMTSAVVEAVNGVIRKINSVSSILGLEVSQIDWTPITVDAPKSIEERWAETKTKMGGHFENMTAAAEVMATDIQKDASDLGDAVGETWKTVETKVDTRVTNIVGAFADGAKEIVATAETKGEEAGKAIVDETKKAVEQEAPKLETAGKKSAGSILKGLKEKLDGADGIGKAFVGGLNDMVNGGSFKSAAQGVATSIGAMIGGPLGSIVGQGLGKAIGVVSSLFSGEGKAEKRKNSIAELQAAIGKGDISTFKGSDDLLATLANQGSAKLTLDAFMAAFGLSAQDAEGLIRVLTDPSALSSASFTRKYNDLLGAGENKASWNMAAGLATIAPERAKTLEEAQQYYWDTGQVPEGYRLDNSGWYPTVVKAAKGFDGMVSRPTMFLAGEAGPEHVQVTPQGSAGFQGSAGNNIYITNNNHFLDVRGVPGFMERFGPELMRYLDRQSVRGARVISSAGVVTERAA